MGSAQPTYHYLLLLTSYTLHLTYSLPARPHYIVQYILHYIVQYIVHHIVQYKVHYILHYMVHYLVHYIVQYTVHYLVHYIVHHIVQAAWALANLMADHASHRDLVLQHGE